MKNPKILSNNVDKIYNGGIKTYEDPADYIKMTTIIKAVKLS